MSTTMVFVAVALLHLQRGNVMARPAELASHPDLLAELERREDSARPYRPPTECVRMAQVTVLARSRSRITLKCGIPRGRNHREYAVRWLLPSGQTVTRQSNAEGPRNTRTLKFELLRKGSLRLHSIKAADSGEYRCIHYATGTPFGRAFQPSLDATRGERCTVTRLIVSNEEKPRMFYQNRTLAVGDLATLNCYTSGMMGSAYTRHWTKNGEGNPDGNHWRIGRAGVSLSLPRVALTDAGTYVCQVVNGSRRSIATIYVNVLDVQPDLAPELVIRPFDQEIRIQQRVVFTCTVRSKGLVQMRWKFCRAKVSPSIGILPADTRRHLLSRVSFEPRDDQEREVTRSVVIDSVLDEDEGYYICLATNTVGTVKSYASLRVT